MPPEPCLPAPAAGSWLAAVSQVLAAPPRAGQEGGGLVGAAPPPPVPRQLVGGIRKGQVLYLVMGRSRPRCKLREGEETNTKGKAQRVRNTTREPKCHTLCKTNPGRGGGKRNQTENQQTKHKGAQKQWEALLQDSARQVLRSAGDPGDSQSCGAFCRQCTDRGTLHPAWAKPKPKPTTEPT